MSHQFTNKLIQESSPYLLQHAHNPVQWFPWGEESLLLAKTQNKPILVSIGYSACHWCHVMERESFEDEKVAEFMNSHFINIKIDREERPDLDHIYMDAVQAIAGSGGWPLNVFLTTDAKPFYGGTYFPPVKAYNRPSWMDVLNSIRHAWENKREDLERQAEELLGHVKRSGNLIIDQSVKNNDGNFQPFTRKDCESIAKNMLKNADTVLGGFGNAPKFPQTFSIQYLLGYSYFFNDKPSLIQAELSLKKMINGGIYDHLAGGLCRYSTDEKWLAPHFEKMLYDNALLVIVLADAFQLTQDEFYAKAMVKTIDFFIDEMRSDEGGFFAALDADSEGVEGKFYVWDFIEVEQILGDKAPLYCKWYGISRDGNWEEKNILHIDNDEQQFCKEAQISPAELHTLIEEGNKLLLDVRKKRIPPQTDDKIILGWNALFLTALCKASAALDSRVYKELAVSLFDFIMIKYKATDTIRFHTYKNGRATHPAFLDDYAYLIQSAIFLQEITADQSYLQTARKLTEYVLENFENQQNGFFYYTHKDQPDLIARKVDCYDGAVPSGNSIMAENLIYLSAVFGGEEWKLRGEKLLNDLKDNIIRYPTSFGIWASLILKQAACLNEIVITGKSIEGLKNQVLKEYIPNKVFQSSTTVEGFPLLEYKEFGLIPYIYVCRNQVCSAPLHSLHDLKLSLKTQFINNKVHNI